MRVIATKNYTNFWFINYLIIPRLGCSKFEVLQFNNYSYIQYINSLPLLLEHSPTTIFLSSQDHHLWFFKTLFSRIALLETSLALTVVFVAMWRKHYSFQNICINCLPLLLTHSPTTIFLSKHDHHLWQSPK